MDPWKQAEKERLERNNSRRTALREEMVLWTEECTQAKGEGRRPGLAKLKLGKLEKPTPKPLAGNNGPDRDDLEGEGRDDESEDDDDD